MSERLSGANDPNGYDSPAWYAPDGRPPVEWLARHPNYVKIPVTIGPSAPTPRSKYGNPPSPSWALAGTAAMAADAGVYGAGMSAAEWMAAPELAPELAALAFLRYAFRIPSAGGPGITPLTAHPDRGTPESIIPPQLTSPLPGMEPPNPPKPGDGGFTGLPDQGVSLPGAPADEQGISILEQRGGTDSSRARANAEKADPPVPKALADADWRAHHLINVAALKNDQGLLKEAAKAGWKIDDSGNVAPLPATLEAQQKLKEADVNRPVHNSGHQNWNEDVKNKLKNIESDLINRHLLPGTDAYAQAARKALENLQDDLRQKMLEFGRLTENSSTRQSLPT